MKIGTGILKPSSRLMGRGLQLPDIKSLYYIVLGREPENDQVLKLHAGSSLSKTVNNFLVSDEFRSLAKTAVAGGGLPHARNLSADNFATASEWVTKTIASGPSELGPSWWLLIQTLLEAVRTDDADELLLRFQEVASENAVKHAHRSRPMEELFRFDPEWFAKRYRHAQLAVQTGAYSSLADYFMAYGLERQMQLLPAFSAGLTPLYRRFAALPGVTLETISTAIRDAAQSGEVSHWLFNEDYYQTGVAWKNGTKSLGQGIEPPYLEFLQYGDRQDFSPHPLFCHWAYRHFNKLDGDDGTFSHYVLDGCFRGCQTTALFDEQFYLAFNPSVKQKILENEYISGLHHFVCEGIYLNNRFSPDFDIDYYMATNPDVAEAAASGKIRSGSYHFLYSGLKEGRQPNPYFDPAYYTRRQPQVGEEMRRLGIRTPLEHFLMLGRQRGYKASPPLTSSPPQIDASKAVFKRRSQRSVNNILREPLNFAPFTSDQPKVSVIVPVFNEADFTAHFLECAYFAAAHFAHSTSEGCEIVFVNNGSTDLTSSLLGSCPGVKIVNFDDAIGFPRAVNAGVAASSGAVVIVANNDIEFAPDAILRAWKRLESDESIGVVGGLVILPNESLQEAGSFVDNNANVIGVGRHEDPWDAYFQGVREADFCSGCFISFRRADFDLLDGFDEGFSPGYYEETDFTFRLREQFGKRAVIDSAIQVVHFEHASFGKGRPPMTAYAIIKRNQAKFVAKHRRSLESKPSTADLMSASGARPKAVGRPRFLIIEDMIPDARLGSGFVRTLQLLSGLSEKGVAFDVLALNPHILIDDYQDPRVRVYRGWMKGEDPESILTRAGDRYSHIIVCRTHNLARLGMRLEELRQAHGIEIICDTEALSVLRVLEMNALAGEPSTPEERLEAIRSELGTSVGVSQWIAVSPYEAQLMAEAGFRPTTTVCQRVPLAKNDLGTWAEKRRILAVGAIHEAGTPNHDGLLWFMDRVYPRCKAVFESHRLTIAGYWNADVQRAFLDRFGRYEIDFLGPVSDDRLEQLYGETKVALAPTRFAAGIAIKVIESMTLGIPIVMTDLIERQIVNPANIGESGLAVGRRDDNGETFAQQLTMLASDEGAWRRMQERQYEIVEPYSSPEAFDSALEKVLTLASVGDRN